MIKINNIKNFILNKFIDKKGKKNLSKNKFIFVIVMLSLFIFIIISFFSKINIIDDDVILDYFNMINSTNNSLDDNNKLQDISNNIDYDDLIKLDSSSSFILIERGLYSGVSEQHVISVKNNDEFSFLWEQSHIKPPIPKLPIIDFSKYSVLFAFYGSFNEIYYKIDSVFVNETHVIVNVIEDSDFNFNSNTNSNVDNNNNSRISKMPFEIILIHKFNNKILLWSKK